MSTIFIGIAGGTGSGKTTLTEHLAQRFGSDISVVHHDNYYKRQDCSFEERCRQNYDHPDAFDTDLMIQHLKALKRGETIYCPVYDYAIHNRTEETVEVKPTKVVIVEGILIFQNKDLRDLLDIKIFVETDAEPVNQLVPEDAATKKEVTAALLRYIDRDTLSARLTTGQIEAFEDILQMTAYFCRRNVKGKDDGMMEGKANMQFLDALNKVIARYESLTPLFEAMAVMMDYDTYWKDLMKNPKIKNPKLVFQSEVEKALLMPSAVIGEYTARNAQSDSAHAVHKEYNWTKVFDEE